MGENVDDKKSPTTVAEAAFVENSSGGLVINVDSTFGGYTLQQIAEALNLAGIIA